MSALGDASVSYLEVRRALGFKLVREGRLVADFVSYLDTHGVETLTAEAALAWACQPADAGPVTWSKRLSAARGFAHYMISVDPGTQAPPTRVWPRRQRLEPFVCTPAQIDALVDAAGSFGADEKTATYQTVIGLLAVTGMRVGEVVGLVDDDIDFGAGVLAVRDAKFGKSREVALHSSTVSALARYVAARDERFGPRDPVSPAGPSVFVSPTGRRLRAEKVRAHWHGAIDRVGLGQHGGRRPRLHDLRHSFAVNTLRAWHEAGLDVEVRLPLLSTYLGHANPASTYWYLTATPDLLAAAANRLEADAGAVS